MTQPHRKLVKHFNTTGHAHFLTFSCYQRMPLLKNASWNVQLARAVDAAITRHNFQLWGFVFMPEHIHLLVYPVQPTYEISQLLYAIKRPFSYRIKQDLLRSNIRLLQELTVQERPGKTAFRFWQEGPGHDPNVDSPEVATHYLEYMHNNPLNRELCISSQDWKYSSYRQYHEVGYHDPDLPRITRFEGY